MRYLEIDLARGIAVTLMIIYHFIFDIFYFSSQFNFYWLAALGASAFILISGVCSNISYSRSKNFSKFARRGIKLFFLGMIVTLTSFLLLNKGFILFGVLHFFALSSFLVYPFLRYFKNRKFYLLSGILIIIFGICLSGLRFDTSYFLWLGLIPNNFYSLDYFPLLPWFGIILIGIFLGKKFYPEGKRNFKFPAFGGKIVGLFGFLGKNSLLIYFIHQPIILSILFLSGHAQFLSAFY